MKTVNKIISLDRDDMAEFERELYLKDFKRTSEEYFETNNDATMEITRADGGFLVCVIFTARRIKSFKRPM